MTSISSTATADPQTANPAAMIDALNQVFGKHAGKRASHAKGFCALGEFIPAAGAGDFVNSSLFKAGTLPATIRFSIGGGNPAVSDKSRSVRGMALRLSGAGQSYDLVLLSEPVFFAATPASFISFLQARVADPTTGKPDPAKIVAHNAAYPEGVRQPAMVAAHAAPASYATTPYFSNNAFFFENAQKVRQAARIVVKPLAGTHYLSAEDEKNLPDSFLQDELKKRVTQAPVEFALYAQLPASGDSLNDSSALWTGSSKVELGRLRIVQLAADESCNDLVFMPSALPDGISPSDDPILQSRTAAYAISLARRNK